MRPPRADSKGKMPKKRGRPTRYTEKVGVEICGRLALGSSLRSICREEKMPHLSTVIRWVLNDLPPDDPRYEFREQYLRARMAQAELMIDEILELADDASQDYLFDPESGLPVKASNVRIQRNKLQCDIRMFYLSKVLPRFGDRMTVEGGEKPLQIETNTRDVRELARQTALILYRADPKRLTHQKEKA